MARRLFGTDGIRGQVVKANQDEAAAINALHSRRVICPSLMRVVGESLGRTMSTQSGAGTTVVVGWDDRPNNIELASSLTLGLRLTGCTVIHHGMCATPGLHRSLLSHQARLGCMITASHNPVSDSGLKVFDSNGFKTTPEFEDLISSIADALASEEREVDDIEAAELSQPNAVISDAHSVHSKWLSERFNSFQSLMGADGFDASRLAHPFVLDSSRGSAHEWFSQWLTERGITTIEVSSKADALNLNCGAGEFSPTQTWTFDEASTSPHHLLQNLSPAPAGTLVGAALDGDGDRCLVIRATATGYMVVDGDAIGDAILAAGTHASSLPWNLAASIESDLALLSTAHRHPIDVHIHETAVGDRWLSKALAATVSSSKQPPRCIGVEDSGHIVMPTEHPVHSEAWSLVGDGAATLVAYLLAVSVGNPSHHMTRGWKQRRSVKDVDRALWTGSNALADTIETMAHDFFVLQGHVSDWNRHGLDGEPNLMLISFDVDGFPASLGVRNSGTQAKISVSLRLSPSIDPSEMDRLMESLTAHLSVSMRA